MYTTKTGLLKIMWNDNIMRFSRWFPSIDLRKYDRGLWGFFSWEQYQMLLKWVTKLRMRQRFSKTSCLSIEYSMTLASGLYGRNTTKKSSWLIKVWKAWQSWRTPSTNFTNVRTILRFYHYRLFLIFSTYPVLFTLYPFVNCDVYFLLVVSCQNQNININA